MNATASATAPTPKGLGKTCVACGQSVDGRKRMKDSKGQYWCYDCGLSDERRKRSGTDSSGKSRTAETQNQMTQCPRCREFFPVTDMVRSKKGKGQLCIECHHAGAKKKRGGGGLMSDMDPARRRNIILGCVVVAVLLGTSIFANLYLF